MPPLIFAYRHFLSLRNLFFVYVTGGFLLLGIFCFAIFTKLRTTTCVYLSTVCSQNHVFFPSWRVAFFRRSDSAPQFFLLPPHSLNACNRLVDRSSRWYLTWSPEPLTPLWSVLLVCTWRHGGHVGGQEQEHFSPMGIKLYFHIISWRKNYIVLTANMARGCKPRI